MHPIRLKISELADATGYTRYQLRGLLSEVFVSHPLGKKSGAQRTFSPQDLGVVAVLCAIERDYAIDRKRLALIAEDLRRALSGPRPANRNARLVITFNPPSAAYLDTDAFVSQGLLVALGSIFAQVDEYLGVSGAVSAEPEQPILPLRPAIATSRRGGARNR